MCLYFTFLYFGKYLFIYLVNGDLWRNCLKALVIIHGGFDGKGSTYNAGD